MKGKPGYVSHFRLEVGEIIALIKAAGGTPVLAHPKLIGDDELVRQLCQQGIEGIEALYPQHDEADTNRYLAMASEYGLKVTGGSDFHGTNRPGTAMGTGIEHNLSVPSVFLDEVRSRCKKNKRASRNMSRAGRISML